MLQLRCITTWLVDCFLVFAASLGGALLFSLTAKSSFASSRSLTALVSTMAPPLHHLCREHYIIFSTGHLAGHLRGTGKGFPFHSVKQTKRQSSWNILLGHILTDTNNHGSLILYINWGKIERELSQSAQSIISVGTWHLLSQLSSSL